MIMHNPSTGLMPASALQKSMRWSSMNCELHVGEFNGTFAGLIAQLPYIQGLGVNVLELMPISPAEDITVILNFSDRDVDAWIPWPATGSWKALINEADSPQPLVQVQQNDEWQPVRVPSHYGAVYLHQ
jgi:hypothetical protein